MLLSGSFLLHRWPEPFLLRRFAPTPHHERLRAVLREIPPEASVSTQRPITLYLAHRQRLYRFPGLGPPGGEPADLVVLDRSLIDRETHIRPFEEGVARLPAKGYKKVREEGTIQIFQRNPPDQPKP
jgi:hypothetical protein